MILWVNVDPVAEAPEKDAKEIAQEFRIILHLLFDNQDNLEVLQAIISWLKSHYGDRR
jgi:hypothetical protein